MERECDKKGMELLFAKLPVDLQVLLLNEEISNPKFFDYC